MTAAVLVRTEYIVEAVCPVETNETNHLQEHTDTDTGTAFEVKEIEQMTNISKSTLYREIGRLKDEAQYEELKKKLKK